MSGARIGAAALCAALTLGACKKSEPPKKPVPEKPAVTAPAPKPPVPEKTKAKPVKKKPKPVKAARKAPEEVDSYVKDILDINAPEVVASGKLSMVFFYSPFSQPVRHIMGVYDTLSVEYKGRVNFFRIDVFSAKRVYRVPKLLRSIPSLFFIKGQRYESKMGSLFNKNPKQQLAFFIEEWLDEDEEDEDRSEGAVSHIPINDPAPFIKTVISEKDPAIKKASRPVFLIYYETWKGKPQGALLKALKQVVAENKAGFEFFKINTVEAEHHHVLPKNLEAVPHFVLFKGGKKRRQKPYPLQSEDKEVHVKELKGFIEGTP